MELLSRTVDLVHRAAWRVGNVDVTVICERPKIRARAVEMRTALAHRMEVAPGRVSVKGKTNEGMGWIGRGEGIAVQAIAALAREPGHPG